MKKPMPTVEPIRESAIPEYGMSLKEIAAVPGVAESRVSQLHGQSVARPRAQPAGPVVRCRMNRQDFQ